MTIKLLSMPTIPVVTATPPSSPVDGQIWACLADATNGIVWMFRYRAASASAYKWECIGQVPLYVAQAGATSAISSSTYVDPSVVCSAVVPRAGDYLVTFGARFSVGSVAANSPYNYLGSLYRNATATDTDIIQASGVSGNAVGSLAAVVNRQTLVTGIAASGTLKIQYRDATGPGFTIQDQFLSIVPVRLA